MYVTNETHRTINVYETYGLPGMWPRGFPLEDVKKEVPRTFRMLHANPLIQQGE